MKSNFSEALNLFKNGKLNEAKNTCEKILKQETNNSQVYNLYAFTLHYLEKFDAAVEYWSKAIKINPNYIEAYNGRGNAFIKLQKLDDAIINFNQAIKINPKYFEAYNNLGNAFINLEKLDQAMASYDQAIKIKPDYAHAYHGRAYTLMKSLKLEEAVNNWNKAIKINPNFVAAYSERGHALVALNRLGEALESYNNAYILNPDYKFLLGNLIHTKFKLCSWKSVVENLEELKNKILKIEKSSPPFPTLSFFDLPQLQKISAEIWIKENFSKKSFIEKIPKKKSEKKIRIGYYSADYYEHATSYLIAELIELHDKSKFEIFGFSFGPDKDDKMRKRISKAFDQFIDVNLKSDKEVAQLSRDLKIDIAVDLKGFTQFSRFGIFVERCAPIQVNYLGHPGTLGTDCIDYIIADKVLIPQKNQKDYSEKIIYLPHCYQVNDSNKKISDKVFTRKELELPKDGFIFCCFNKNYKITPNVFDCWMKILKKVKGSVLWLFENNPITIKNLQQEANKRDVGSDRLIFAKPMALDKHLARHKVADLFLDTFPYTAHTTCSDALWAGLPVLTCTGESFASRVSASLLNAIGLSELVTHTHKEYEGMAIELANNLIRLKEIKNELEKNKLEKPLFNTKLFTKHIESAYTEIHKKYIKNKKPDHIKI